MKWLSLIFSLIALNVGADTYDSGYRTSIQIEKAFSNRLLLRSEQENYVYENFDVWYQSLVRVAVGYQISDKASLLLGYDYIPTHLIGKPFVAQQNVWPAFRYILPLEYGSITYRLMLESNFVGSPIRERPRQLIRYMVPFEFEPHLSLILWDEVYYRLNSTDWVGRKGFDSNSAFAGLGWTFHSGLRTELGYYNQYIDDALHHNITMRHFIQMSLIYNF